MADEPKTGFFQTLSGILTGIAAVIGSIAALVGILYQSGLISKWNRGTITVLQVTPQPIATPQPIVEATPRPIATPQPMAAPQTTVEAPLQPPQHHRRHRSVSPQPIVSSGEANIRLSFSFNLDQGTDQVSESTPVDFQWSQSSPRVRDLYGQRIVNLGRRDFEALTLEQLQKLNYSAASINGNDDNSNQLVNGDVFAVITHLGNYSKVKVLAYGYNLHIRWVTYARGNLSTE